MLILILRHGEAERVSSGDGERHLTSAGSVQVETVLNLAKKMGANVEKIASSPLPRAKETASIASKIFGQTYTVINALEPDGSTEGVYDELSKYEISKTVLLVSHQPLVSELVEDMLGTPPAIHLPAGALAIINVKERPSRRSGLLVSLLPPLISNS